ncbi:MAG: TSUP family transporter [Candidatus Limnocylindrus sp.]
MDSPLIDEFLPLAFFAVALLYSSVGHAGATGYLALMALAGLAPEVMRPTALVLNLAVACIAVVRFAHAEQLPWRTLPYFVIGSIPAAYLAGSLEIPDTIYRPLLATVLIAAALRLAARARRDLSSERAALPPRRFVAALVGVVIGLLAGATGTGGGVFLTPLVIARRWASTRAAAGLSAGFILANSIAGLAARPASLDLLPATLPLALAAAAVGGSIGSELGARRVSLITLRRILAAVMVIAATRLVVG